MIEGHDILCFAPGPWDDIWRNRHHIMTRLARDNRVLYVEPWPYIRPTVCRLRDGGIGVLDMVRGGQLHEAFTNLYVYQPPLWTPRTGRFPPSSITRTIYIGLLRRVLRRLRFKRPILWLFLPDTEVFIGHFGEQLVIYHIVDEYSGYAGVSDSWRPVVRRMEEQLARRADLVFVTSPTLLERNRRLNESIFLVPNAVDYEAFSAILGSETQPPDDVASIPPPIAGYVGAINDKVNLHLLVQVSRRRTNWSVVLVGPVAVADNEAQRALEILEALPNVYLLGRKNVEDVPRYIAACDVCLLPYRINEWTRSIDSLKLYEYLACGKPVVATDVPAARRFSESVMVAADEAEFAMGIDVALSEDGPVMQARRRAVAAQHTWDQRVESLSAAIEERLGKHAGCQRDEAMGKGGTS